MLVFLAVVTTAMISAGKPAQVDQVPNEGAAGQYISVLRSDWEELHEELRLSVQRLGQLSTEVNKLRKENEDLKKQVDGQRSRPGRSSDAG
jgi:septal ring factor EnvC (AmiA/AmiB activator)